MADNILIGGAVAVGEGILAGAINSYNSNDTENLLEGESRSQQIERDFISFEYDDQVEFDRQDVVFEEFIAENPGWRNDRPSPKHWMGRSMKTSLYLTLISALISTFGCVLAYLCMKTGDMCSWLNVYDIPKPLQQVKVVSQSMSGQCDQYFFILTMTCAFGFKLVHNLNLIYWSIVTAFLDTMYRMTMYMFGLYGETWKSYPLNFLFLLTVFSNCYILSRYYLFQ